MEKLLPPSSLLLAGLPATGKSSFGNWLEENKGYFHLDFDEEDIIQQRGFGHAQDRAPRCKSCASQKQSLRRTILWL